MVVAPAHLRTTLLLMQAFPRFQVGDHAGAERVCTEVLDSGTPHLHERSQALHHRAMARRSLGRVADASGDASAAHRLDPNNAETSRLYAQLLVEEYREVVAENASEKVSLFF